MFKKYDDYLSHRTSDDFWYDFALDEVFEILLQFTGEDWNDLLQQVKEKDSFWQKKCAESLSDVDRPEALKVLILLLNANSLEVAFAAISSLRSFVDMGYFSSISIEEIKKIEAASKHASHLELLVIESFLNEYKNAAQFD